MIITVQLEFLPTGATGTRFVLKDETLPRSGSLAILVTLDEPAFLYVSGVDPDGPGEPVQRLVAPQEASSTEPGGPKKIAPTPAGSYRFPADPRKRYRLDRSPGNESVWVAGAAQPIDQRAPADDEERLLFWALGFGARGIPPRGPEGGQTGRGDIVVSKSTTSGIAYAMFPYVHG